MRDPPSIAPKERNQPKAIPELQALMISVLEHAAQKYHDPEHAISIVAGATGTHQCSDELFRAFAAISDKYNLPRHLHLLETRNQQQVAFDKYGESAVAHLSKLGYLNHSTSCAHSVHLTDADIELLAHTGASVVHNPLSNLRLGSGIAPILKYVASNMPDDPWCVQQPIV
jgi:5-methylthioadenosine/S-adenosylhomocysteine deaminase